MILVVKRLPAASAWQVGHTTFPQNQNYSYLPKLFLWGFGNRWDRLDPAAALLTLGEFAHTGHAHITCKPPESRHINQINGTGNGKSNAQI